MKVNETSGIIIQVDQYAEAAAEQSAYELRNAMKRHMERMARFAAWVTPEAVKDRREAYEKAAVEALELGKSLARTFEPIPVPDPLPKEMIGQSPSTIQAMLRHKRDG